MGLKCCENGKELNILDCGRLRIGVDMDDVLNDLVDQWIKLYNKQYNDSLKISDIIDFGVYKFAREGKKVYNTLSTPGLFRNLNIQPNAYDGLKFLNDNAEVYIITASRADNHMEKIEWMTENLDFIDKDQIIFCPSNAKHLINIDYMIDDRPDTIDLFGERGIVFTKPWNLYLKDKYKRVDNWNDIMVMFKKIFEETYY